METYLDTEGNVRYTKGCRLVSVDKLHTFVKPTIAVAGLADNVLHDNDEEIEKIAFTIVNHFGGVQQDVPGVQADLESVLRGYLHRTFK